MGVEIERKFLVVADLLPELSLGVTILQGYITTGPVVRVRVQDGGGGPAAFLTMKGAGFISRREYEYEIPVDDAREMLDLLCVCRIEKVRYMVKVGEHVWEIDRFTGSHEGLWIAEIELGHADEKFEHPPWVGKEVSFDGRYTNASLALAATVP